MRTSSSVVVGDDGQRVTLLDVAPGVGAGDGSCFFFHWAIIKTTLHTHTSDDGGGGMWLWLHAYVLRLWSNHGDVTKTTGETSLFRLMLFIHVCIYDYIFEFEFSIIKESIKIYEQTAGDWAYGVVVVAYNQSVWGFEHEARLQPSADPLSIMVITFLWNE